ncbi:hypothetical protein Avbf_01633 [Armadillidium vulgare]|nr:hypothetical protein Avbf_01633 [Armadillidium vulgare]
MIIIILQLWIDNGNSLVIEQTTNSFSGSSGNVDDNTRDTEANPVNDIKFSSVATWDITYQEENILDIGNYIIETNIKDGLKYLDRGGGRGRTCVLRFNYKSSKIIYKKFLQTLLTNFYGKLRVRYNQKGSDFQDSYVAKVNPCYPISVHTEVLETMFHIETDVLLIIITAMNEQLHKLNLPHIGAAKLYARNLEKGREVFISENLRAQGFMSNHNRKAMDFDHTVLVLKELGRFHASSLLYEETLHPKSIEEFFNFKVRI